MPTYQPNIPTGSVPFNEDYLNLQANFQQLNIAYGVDHVPFSNTSGISPGGQSGKHTIIHLQAASTTASNPPNNYPPTAVPTVSVTGEVFCTQSNDGVSTDEILWYQSGGGRLMQLTRNFLPVASTNGYTFIPGGLILQWGTSTKSTDGSTSFPLAFPSNCFGVNCNIFENNNNRHFISVKTKSTSAFTVSSRDSSGNDESNTFFWIAIGN